MELKVSADRMKKDIEAIGNLSRDDELGRTCFSYGERDMAVRSYLMDQMVGLGMEVSVDGVGNVRGRLPGRADLAPVLSGSHVDSVFQGGDYDGVVGVVAALEVARCLATRDEPLERPYEVVIFSEEEGSNFGVTCAGSKAMTGYLSLEDLKKLFSQSGMSMYDMCSFRGFEPDRISSQKLVPGDIHAMVELHVEQSVVLESESMEIGVVQSIAGLCQSRIKLKGSANHAGSTPMRLRQDALVGAARVIYGVKGIVQEDQSPSVVGTVGYIKCDPNVSNVIPGEVEFSLDVRDVSQEAIDRVMHQVGLLVEQVASDCGLERSMEVLGRQSPVNMSQSVARTIADSARSCELSCRAMNSGAVHDSVLLSSITDTGLIFVPSKGGKSHCPEEYTSIEQIAKGAQVLLSTVISLAE